MDVSELSKWIPIAVGSITIINAGLAAATWVNIRGRKAIRQQLNRLYTELMPNGGKSLNDAVRRTEAKLDAGLRFSATLQDIPTWEADAAGKCVWASPALCQLFGLSQSDMLHSGWLDAIATQEEREKISREWATALKHQIPFSAVYTIHNRSTGEHYLVESRSWPCTADGKPFWYYGSCQRKLPVKTTYG